MLGASLVETTLRDASFGIRMLSRRPGFTALAVLSLAIGIGLNSTVFSIVDAAFLRPMSFNDSETIVRVKTPEFSYPEYRDLRRQCRSLSGVVAVSRHVGLLRNQDSIETLAAEVVSPNYFAVLGIRAALGNVFSEEDPRLLTNRLVVISYGLWQRHFGGDPAIVGKTIPLNYAPYTVLGVAQKGYSGASRIPKIELWFPIDKNWGMENREIRDFSLLGRLVLTASSVQVQAEVKTIVSQLGFKDSKTGYPQQVLVWSEARDTMDRGKVAIIAMICVGMLLLVACTNVSSMLLARNEERRCEIAVRLALGASRGQLVRQLLVESILLTLVGVAFGFVLTIWAKDALLALIPANFLQFAPEFRLDRRVLDLTIASALMATLVFGLAPAWRASKTELAMILKGETRPGRNRWRQLRGRNVLVVGQLAVSVVFLIASGVLVKGYLKGLAVDLGFKRKEMLCVVIPGMEGEEGRTYYAQLQERVRALSGVKQVSLATRVPFALSGGGATEKVFIPVDETAGNGEGRAIGFNIVAPNFFQTMGITLLRGRPFNEHDDRSHPRVCIISDAMARRYWPGKEPVGQSIRIGNQADRPTEIVGVARDVVSNEIGETPEPFIYLPVNQRMQGDMTLLVVTQGDAPGVLGLVRHEMRSLNKDIAPMLVDTQKELVHFALLPQWATAWLLGVLGFLTFMLSVAGLYGVVSYSVARRTHEIGVRMALGAQIGDTLRMILRQALVLALFGLAVGLPAAYGVCRLLQSLLFGLNSGDPATFLGASFLVLAVAVLAGYFPASRAARVDVNAALKYG
jgi:putative ABC transport system permease protein